VGYRLPFSLFLALRYLKPKRTFLSIITLISILGVTLGISLLIVVMSIMTGFGLELQKKVIGFEPHIVLGRDGIVRDWRSLSERAERVPGVTATAPFVIGPVIVEFNGHRLAPKIRGIDLERESALSNIEEFLIAGEADLEGDNTLLGSEVARSLRATVGDTITVYSPRNMGELMDRLNELEDPETDRTAQVERVREVVLPRELMVTGIFESGRFLYDSEFIMVPLHIGQELYDLEDGVHGIGVKTVDPYKAALVQQALRMALDEDVTAYTWMDMNRQLFDAIGMERGLMFFLMLCVSVVAGFCIMNTLITVSVLKTREVGVMKALGAANSQVVWVFLLQGMVVGLLGTLSGLIVGIAVVMQRDLIQQMLARILGIEIFPAAVYEFSSIPAKIIPQDVAFICLCAFVICSLAAWLPAWVAARLDPVKALRYE
jgi:lipoprotein-releasing system permease protein